MSDDQFFYQESLRQSLATFKERNYLIDGLLYEHSALMIYAADGLGKSTLILQLCLEASSGSNVYGVFKTKKPLRILWVMTERHPIEILERIRQMEGMININYDNFALTTEIQGTNLLNRTQFDSSVETLAKRVLQMEYIDIIVIDPIYAIVAGGLGKDENDSHVTRFSTILQNKFNCSCIFLHHPNRGIKDRESGERYGEDMYGGRFLSAHFTGIYHLIKSRVANGCRFEREKNSHQNLVEGFDLSYDTDSYISTIKDDSMLKRDRLLIELRRLKVSEEWFELPVLAKSLDFSTQYLYKLFSRELKDDVKKHPNSNKRKTLYKYIGM